MLLCAEGEAPSIPSEFLPNDIDLVDVVDLSQVTILFVLHAAMALF